MTRLWPLIPLTGAALIFLVLISGWPRRGRVTGWALIVFGTLLWLTGCAQALSPSDVYGDTNLEMPLICTIDDASGAISCPKP